MHILEDLKFRDLINQHTDFDVLRKRLLSPCVLYCGFDATADSLQVGNLLPLVCLKRFQAAGHKPIILLGAGTSLIGDPSGKKTERVLSSKETVAERVKKIKKQLASFFGEKKNYQIISNDEWLGSAKLLDFIRDIGKHFSVGYMLAKESVRSRIESGISFTEFSYMLLQAYDFLKLNEKRDCELQIGGSDQWGNITAGIDLIRKVRQREAFGLTIPLVVKSDGSKFGKTETGTIWLDPLKTTPYQFYQFWINTEDKNAVRFLKYFTFLPHEEIKILEEGVKNNPGKREAQRVLAREITKMVHGENSLLQAEKITETLFVGDIKGLSEEDVNNAFGNMPSYSIESGDIVKIIDLLVNSGVSSSKRQAREDIQTKSVAINGDICSDMEKIITSKDSLFGKYLIIRKGKKKYFLMKWK